MNIQDYIESGIVETYVFGLANAVETDEVELLMRQDAAVKDAVNSFADELEKTVLINRTEPPSLLKAKIMAAIALQAEEEKRAGIEVAPILSNQKNYTFSVMRLSYWKNLAAACVILFTAGTVLNIYTFERYKKLKNNYEDLSASHNNLIKAMHASTVELNLLNENIKAINAPFYISIKMPGVRGRQDCIAIVYWNRLTKDVYLLKQKLPATPPGRQYQLWAIFHGKPVDAGLVNDIENISRMKNIAAAESFAVTLEKKGGSDVPDLKQLYVMGNI